MSSEDPPFDRYALPPLEGVTDSPTPAPAPPVDQAVPPPPPVPSRDPELHDWREEMEFEVPALLTAGADDDANQAEDAAADETNQVDEADDVDAVEATRPAPEEDDPPKEADTAYFATDFDEAPEPGPLARRSRLRSPLASAARAADMVDSLRARTASAPTPAASDVSEADAQADAVVFATAAHGVRDDDRSLAADEGDADATAIGPPPIAPPPVPSASRPGALAPTDEDDAPGEDDELPDFLRADAIEAAFGIKPDSGEQMTLLAPEPYLTETVADEAPVRVKEKPKPTVARTLAEIPILLIVAALIAFLVKTFLAQAYYIPSGSMLPQLQIDDRVVVSKLAYKVHDPRRGDIVVFDDPRPGASDASESDDSGVSKWARKVGEGVGIVQPSTDEFIKRVIGLPGDKVSGHDGAVYINGHKLLEPYLPNGVETTDFPTQTVASGRLWVMGDNRNGSADSRVFGQIKISSIVGRAVVKVWPFDHISFL